MPLSDNTPHWLNQLNPPPVNSDELTPPVSPSEVELQLKRLPWQSAPGQDRLPYSLWKSTPSSASVLGPIFSTCLANAKIPASWKTSTTILIYKKGDESSPDNWTTILIYKKGDESSPDNWRPISLQNTLYKIYAAILSSKDDIVRSLSAFSTFSSWSGLRLNVNKCGCFSFIQQQLQRTLWLLYDYGTEQIPALHWEDSYRYLGVHTARQRSGVPADLSASVLATTEKILSSKLTDWQKIDAFNLFAISTTSYLLNSTLINRSWASKLEQKWGSSWRRLSVSLNALCAPSSTSPRDWADWGSAQSSSH